MANKNHNSLRGASAPSATGDLGVWKGVAYCIADIKKKQIMIIIMTKVDHRSFAKLIK